MNIKFLSSDRVAVDMFPPVPASKMLPDWYKELGRYVGGAPMTAPAELARNNYKIPQTVKGCPPVLDYLTSGYIIRMPADLSISPTPDGDIKSWESAGVIPCTGNPHAQMPIHIHGRRHAYIKIMQDWVVKTPAGYSSYFYQPEFLFDERIKLFPAVVDTDTYPHPVNFPGIVTSTAPFVLAAGTPLMVVFPFKREEWAHSVEHMLAGPAPSLVDRIFQRGYQRFFRAKKIFK